MINTVVLMGRLTAEPVLKTTTTGKNVCSFCIAVDRSFKSGDERQADFINIVAWNSTAEFICRYFKKGALIALEGSVRTRQYTDKSGNKRTAFEVIAEQVSFCGGKSEGAAEPNEPIGEGFSTAQPGDFEEIADDDDLPL